MEPLEDLHGPIFGSNKPPENTTASNYRGPQPRPIFYSNPRWPEAMPCLPSNAYSHPGPPSAMPCLPSNAYSHPGPPSAMPCLPSNAYSHPGPPSAMPCLPSNAYNHHEPPPAIPYLPSNAYNHHEPPPAIPYLPSNAHSHHGPPPAMQSEPSNAYSHHGPPPAVTQLPSNLYSDFRQPSAIQHPHSNVYSNPKPPSTMQIQDRTPLYHHHRIPHSTILGTPRPPMRSTGGLHAGNLVSPPIENAVGLPRRDVGGLSTGREGAVSSPIKRTIKAPPVKASLKRQQTETKKPKPSKTNISSTRKKTKTTKARPTSTNHAPHDENDVRNKIPQDWDEVEKIQQVFESVVRSFARVTAQPPPIVSPWCSYQHQRAVFQQALDHYWRLERRSGPPPELANLGPWHGPIKSITDAPVAITEEDLEVAIHPSLALYQPVEGSIAWLEQNHNLDNLLANQMQFNAHPPSSRR